MKKAFRLRVSEIRFSSLYKFSKFHLRGIASGLADSYAGSSCFALPFTPEIVLPALAHVNEIYPNMTSKYSFNPTFDGGNQGKDGWVSQGYYGLEQCPIVLMIENYRTGFFWRLVRNCPYIIAGLQRAGFTGGWLG